MSPFHLALFCVMPNMSCIDDNAIAPGGLQWLTVTSNIAGLILILGTVHLLHLFIWPSVSRALFRAYVPPPGNHHSTLTEIATSDSSLNPSRPTSPTPHTARPTPHRPTNRVTRPSRQLPRQPRPATSRPGRHADDPIARA
ncbi:hypothetical protein M405DRAFT_815706 [Rhizopogon salebrosus TDB-379]|nr:hypothetical protein M405DRAFT_815706 [Rhizopogon salebrosus TDB-379]